MTFMDLRSDRMSEITYSDGNIYYIYITLRKTREKIKVKNTCFFLEVFIQ